MLETIERGDVENARRPALSLRLRVRVCRREAFSALGSAALVFLLTGCKPDTRSELAPALTAKKSAPRETKLQPPDPAGPRRTFQEIVALPDEKFDVAEAVLSLASEIPAESGGSGEPDIAAML